jgi:hypothetical protein
MVFPEGFSSKGMLISQISLQGFLRDSLIRLAAIFLLFSQMKEHLKPKCLGGFFLRAKKAFSQGD